MLMRKIALVSAALLLIATTACKKEEDSCYHCTWNFYTSAAGVYLENQTMVQRDTTICDMDSKSIIQFEERYSATYKRSKSADHMESVSQCKPVGDAIE